jgi:hypothetical protein
MTASRSRRYTTTGMLGCQPDKHGSIHWAVIGEAVPTNVT